MKHQKRVKSILGVILSLVMILATLPVFPAFAKGVETTNDLTGTVTLSAPQDPAASGKYVDLTGMTVTAYQVLYEENAQKDVEGDLYIVNPDFAEFFADASKTFYDGDTYVKAGKVDDNAELYFSYDSNAKHLTLSNVSTDGAIHIQGSKLRDIIAAEEENKKYFEAGIMEAILGDAAYAKTFAEWLRNYAVSNGIDHEKKVSVTDGDDTGNPGDPDAAADTFVFEGLPLGYWLLVSDNAPHNVANVETVFRLSQQNNDTQAQLKLENQELEKQVKNSTHAGAFGDSTTAETGDVLNYVITTNVPDLRDYDGSRLLSEGQKKEEYEYKISDTLHNQWLVNSENKYVSNKSDAAFDADVFKITITYKDGSNADKTITLVDKTSPADGEALRTYLKSSSTYGSYDAAGTKTQTFVLDFNVEQLRLLEIDKAGSWKEATMTVQYNAELTSDAVLVNDNEVEFRYSNDPKTTTPKDTTDETKVYSYGFELTKEFENDASSGNIEKSDPKYEELAKKVTFELYPATGYSTETGKAQGVGEKPIEVVGDNGDYQRADSEDPTEPGAPAATDKKTELKLDPKTGVLKVYGLDEGYYVLKETAAPGGYAKINEIVIYIDANEQLWLYDQSNTWVKEGKADLETSNDNGTIVGTPGEGVRNYLKFSALNERGMSLPETGGAGVLMLLIGGILLITLAAAMVLNRKKNRAE